MTDVECGAPNKLEKPAEDGVEEAVGQGQEEEEEDPYATSAIFVNTDVAFAETAGQRDKSEKDLNSPDSNDSGIQADSQSFQHLSDDLDLYAVVKKTKKKDAKDHAPEEPTESTGEPLTITSSSKGGVRVAREEADDDPYSAVDFDSEEKEEDKQVFSVIQKKKKVPRSEEQEDDGDETSNPDLNGNTRFHADDSDEKDDDKLSDSSDLPEGWQRHEDEQGSYYWHIKSGITQRDPPSPVLQVLPATKKHSSAKAIHSTRREAEAKMDTKKDSHEPLIVTCAKSKPSKQSVSAVKVDDPLQNGFHVRCLGSLPLSEDELSDDRSGQAINQCISSLSHRPGILQNGTLQGRNLYLEFSGEDLLLIDVNSSTVVRSESVRSVRVWGVGKEKDSRDFAYVARDPDLGRHVCWVFKCERTGHEVASALRSICVRILNENENYPGKKSSAARVSEISGNHLVYDSRVSRDSQKNQTKNGLDQSKKNWNGQSKLWNDSVVFPVPMSESKKVINCHYLGMMKVPNPLGMEILNDAIEMVHSRVPSSKWVAVSVEVAPSAVTVYDRGRANSVILECRIRFLTFLGIGINNCRLVAFIMHSAQDEFFAHVFHCTPDAGVFCRTVKAACKLRYQKCLDAQNQKDRDQSKSSHQTSTGSMPPFQVLKESFQKGVNNLLSGYGKNK